MNQQTEADQSTTLQQIMDECLLQDELVCEIYNLLEEYDFSKTREKLRERLKDEKKRLKRKNEEMRSFLKQFAMASRQNMLLLDLVVDTTKPEFK